MTTYSQTNTDNTYGTQSNKYWGANFTNATFQSSNVSSLTYYFRKETAGSTSVTINLATLDASGDVLDSSIASKTITVTNPSFTECTFDSLDYDVPVDGCYFMCYDMTGLSTNVEFAVTNSPSPSSSDIVNAAKKLNDATAPVDFTDYPKVTLSYTPASGSSSTLLPPPVAWI